MIFNTTMQNELKKICPLCLTKMVEENNEYKCPKCLKTEKEIKKEIDRWD